MICTSRENKAQHGHPPYLSSGFADGTTIWAITRDVITYRIGDKGMLKRDCAYARSRLTLHCLHTQSIEVKKGTDQILDV